MLKMIQHNQPTISEKDKDLVSRVFDSGWLAAGENVSAFEAQFAEIYGLPSENVVAVSSGSAAIFLALMAMDARSKRVAIPAFSCSSLENAVQLAQARPIYIDSCEESFNMNQDLLDSEDLVVHPHMFGFPSVVNDTWKSRLIEDCAQSIGSLVDGKLAGLQGEIGIFSFYATKMLTTAGQGGLVIAKNADYISFIKDFIEFDQKNDGKIRFNFSMTDVQAAMGRNQLIQLFDYFIPRRDEIFKKYCSTGRDFYTSQDSRLKPVSFRALLKVSSQMDAIEFLKNEGVKSIVPVSEKEILGGNEVELTNAYKHSRSWISIPCYPSLSEKMVHKITSAIDKMGKI
jgi:perosamine synthetase